MKKIILYFLGFVMLSSLLYYFAGFGFWSALTVSFGATVLTFLNDQKKV